jgi:hypothetical protein
MATTPNFSWPTPDNTDLVKNGALAIRTLGDAIDASLVDLEGGTTGQVLSKTSNTDMDFTWVTTDDANAIQNAIVDAKGDLIAATADDTPARLAVGANTAPLVADSTQSTGLRWDNDAWTSYTPTWTSSGTQPTIGNGDLIGLFKQRGKVVHVRISLVAGSTSTFGTGVYFFALPVTAANTNLGGMSSHAWVFDSSAGAFYHAFADNNDGTGKVALRTVVTNATFATLDTVTQSSPFSWAQGDQINFSFTYQAA